MVHTPRSVLVQNSHPIAAAFWLYWFGLLTYICCDGIFNLLGISIDPLFVKSDLKSKVDKRQLQSEGRKWIKANCATKQNANLASFLLLKGLVLEERYDWRSFKLITLKDTNSFSKNFERVCLKLGKSIDQSSFPHENPVDFTAPEFRRHPVISYC